MRTLLIGSIILFFCITSGNAQMTIHHINVQQGDATLIEFQTAAILLDAGGSRTNAVKNHLLEYLDQFFEDRPHLKKTLYSVIISHPHADHLQWLKDVLNRYKVLNLVDNGDKRDKIGSQNNGSMKAMKEARALFNQQANAAPGTRFYNSIDASDITPKGYMTPWFKDLKAREPLAEVVYLAASRICRNPNNGSVVVRVRYGETSILVTGDAEDEEDGACVPTIPRMIEQLAAGELDVDIYKAGHHASPNGTNLPYLQRMTPRIVVISAGDRDDGSAEGFGHPRTDTVNLIANTLSLVDRKTTKQNAFGRTASRARGGQIRNFAMSKAVYCTCWDGDIRIPTDNQGRLLLTSIETSN